MFCDYTGVDEHVKKFHTNEADFLDYIAELKKLKVVICNKCNMTLQNRYLLQEHENNVHSIVNSEVCSVCGKNYKNLRVYAITWNLCMQLIRPICVTFVQPNLNGLELSSSIFKMSTKESGSSHVQHVAKSSSVNLSWTVTYESTDQMNQSVSHVPCVIKDLVENNYLRHMKTIISHSWKSFIVHIVAKASVRKLEWSLMCNLFI